MEKMKQITELQSDWKDDKSEISTKYPPFLFRLVRFGFQTLGRIFPNKAAKVAYQLFSTPRVRAKHRTPDPILEQAQLFEVLFGKYILKGYEWGKGEKTVLLVHGWESRGTALRTFVPALLEKGYKVVAMDGPAHGNSSGKSTNIVEFSGAVLAFIQQLGGVHGIITHSFGGASTMFGLEHLNDSIAVEKLVLVAVPSNIRDVFKQTAKSLNLPPVVANKFQKILEAKANMSMEEVDDQSKKESMKVSDVLIVHDKKDIVVPFINAERNYQQMSNANMLTTNGLGHFRLMKNPDLIAYVTDFVAKN